MNMESKDERNLGQQNKAETRPTIMQRIERKSFADIFTSNETEASQVSSTTSVLSPVWLKVASWVVSKFHLVGPPVPSLDL